MPPRGASRRAQLAVPACCSDPPRFASWNPSSRWTRSRTDPDDRQSKQEAVAVDWQNSTEAGFDSMRWSGSAVARSLGGWPRRRSKPKATRRGAGSWLPGYPVVRRLRSSRVRVWEWHRAQENPSGTSGPGSSRPPAKSATRTWSGCEGPTRQDGPLEEKIRRAEQAAEREKEQANQQKMQTAISIGSTLLGAFLGRKVTSAANMGRAATTLRSGGRTWKETQDIARAQETVGALRQQMADLESQFAAEAQAIGRLRAPRPGPSRPFPSNSKRPISRSAWLRCPGCPIGWTPKETFSPRDEQENRFSTRFRAGGPGRHARRGPRSKSIHP